MGGEKKRNALNTGQLDAFVGKCRHSVFMRTKPYCAHWRRRNVRTVQLSGRTVYVRWNGKNPYVYHIFERLTEGKWPRMTRRRLGKLSLLEVFYVSPRRWLDFFSMVVLCIFLANPPEERWIFETYLARFSSGNYGERRSTVFFIFKLFWRRRRWKQALRGGEKSEKKTFFPSRLAAAAAKKKSLSKKVLQPLTDRR